MISDTHEPMRPVVRFGHTVDAPDCLRMLFRRAWAQAYFCWSHKRGHRKGTKGRTLRSWRVGR